MRLMVVDDDVQIREGITYGIQWENLGIDEAVCFKDGFDALAGMKAKPFDLGNRAFAGIETAGRADCGHLNQWFRRI